MRRKMLRLPLYLYNLLAIRIHNVRRIIALLPPNCAGLTLPGVFVTVDGDFFLASVIVAYFLSDGPNAILILP